MAWHRTTARLLASSLPGLPITQFLLRTDHHRFQVVHLNTWLVHGSEKEDEFKCKSWIIIMHQILFGVNVENSIAVLWRLNPSTTMQQNPSRDKPNQFYLFISPKTTQTIWLLSTRCVLQGYKIVIHDSILAESIEWCPRPQGCLVIVQLALKIIARRLEDILMARDLKLHRPSKCRRPEARAALIRPGWAYWARTQD